VARDAEQADWPRGLHLAHQRQPVLLARLERPRLDLRAVLLPQSSVEPEPVWSAAAAPVGAPVQRLLVVLVAAAVVRPAPWSWVRTRRPSSNRWRACTQSGSYVS
jgi:hypothetical protein